MSKCKLFSLTEKQSLVTRGIIAEDGKVLDEGLLSMANIQFKEDFKKVYNEDVTGLGSVRDGKFVVNKAATRIENRVRSTADMIYPGVDLTNNNAQLGASTVYMPAQFTEQLAFNAITEKTKDFDVVNERGDVVAYTLGDILKEFPNSGFTAYVKDIQSKQFDYIAGLAIPKKLDLIAYLDEGKSFENTVEREMKEFSTPRAYMEDLVEKSSNVDENLSAINDAMNRVLSRTKTNIGIVMERGGDTDVMGMTDGALISLSPFNIGVYNANKHGKLAYVYMHEKAHVVTMGLLNKDKEYRAEMERLYKEAQDAGITGYGMTNILEFAAEALSNPTFQQDLANVETKEKSIWQKFVDAFSKAVKDMLGIELDNNLLGEVLLANLKAMEGTPTAPLNTTLSANLDVIMSMDMNGNFIGEDGDIEALQLSAKKLGIVFKPGEGFFYTNYAGDEQRISREQLPLHIQGAHAEYTNNIIFGTTDPKTLDTSELVEQPPIVYNRAVDPLNIFSIESIHDLHAAQIQISPPSNNDHGMYEVAGKKYFRTTESLGFGVTELQTDELLANAAHIGNFKDELGKRIFSDAYAEDTITYDKINAFVKQEAFERAQKEEMITLEEFNKTYKNPVAEDAYETLKMELARIKGDLMENQNVKKFHSDIIVWDNERRVAGEIDVLAELHDGSFTVIDIKTRRKGTDDYEQHVPGNWSTEEKHILQTNTYTNFMEKMGFKMNAPKIIMSRPEYPSDVKVNQAPFVEIEGDNFAILLDLPRVSDEKIYDDKGTLTYTIDKAGPGGTYDSKLAAKSAAARAKYRTFLAGQRAEEGLGTKGPALNVDEATEQLRDNIIDVQNTLQQYTNFVKKNPSYSKLSIELEAVLEAIKKTTGEDVDDLVMEDAILIATKFFKYAAIQLQELQAELRNAVGDVADRKDTYLRIKNYKGVFGVAQELFETLEVLSLASTSHADKVVEAREEFKQFEGVNTTLQTDLNITLKDLYRAIIAETYLGSKGEIKMINELRKEAEAIYGKPGFLKQNETNAVKEKIDAYINKARRSDDFTTRVMEASREEVNALINKPVSDISMAAYLFNSDVSVNNEYVQLFHQMLLNNEDRFSTMANEKVLELGKLNKELGLSEKDIRALVVQDSEGDSFLISDYKIEWHNEVKKRRDAIREVADKLKEAKDDKEIAKLNKELKKLKEQWDKWYNANTEGSRERNPIAKWKTDYSTLSENQRKALSAFKDITNDNQRRISGQSLIMSTGYLGGAFYYRTPGVLKTTFGHAFDGELVSVAKKYWNEATKIELGDVEEGQVSVEKGDKLGDRATDQSVKYAPTGLDGKPIFTIPIFFRGRPKENQNMDLFTIYALELQNGLRYQVDTDVVADATIFLDMVNDSDFIQTTGMSKEKIVSLFRGEGNQDAATIKGDSSNVSKMIEKMMKNRVFAMTQEYGGKVFGKDVNRIMATVGSYTAFASMSFKVLGSANNWVTGNISAALEAVGGEFYTKKDLAAAKAMYYNNIGSTMNDIGAPTKHGYINQLLAIFDVQGERDILNNNFERRNKFTQLLQPGTTLAGYSMGEHEIHATVMLAILHSNKVLDSKGNYLNKAGEIVTNRDDAASLADAYVKEADGIVRLQKWAEYSEFDTQNKLNKTGQASMRGLIKDRIFRTQGAFDKHMQSELNRRWYGKLFFQFKKHMAPHLLNRFRGLNHVRTDTGTLNEDKKYFNFSAKTEEYGYYTTFIRFALNTMKAEKLNIAGYMKHGSNQWKDLSKHERANMIKTITEAGYILGTFILASMAVAAADDDDDLMWAMIYLLRRQTNEGGLQYINPAENWRILESPMAAMGKVNSIIDSFTQILSMTEEYESGIHKGENKFKVKATRVIMLDRLDQFEKGYNKRMYKNLTKD